ncbi:RNA polymerase sigma-70 factor, ECF subfamily [Chryseobacterium arachidis]|uniref:RNA polymerase sigma-70 factor, ECF subfamily n=2 Tax=Chryseobacterium arachidis TaxID=1416778 RepID=A0A1M5IB46_9FLAO|nr:sigma-70 family RNA polymerase sigma factor [Chryseobacterium arachidis]SHG25584.1 RNA polymerase sigma-70 factor, ECF subfamily [Chryseobacterium arachidis]
MKSTHEIEERALLTDFQSGDRMAFDKIFRLHHASLVFFANRLIVNYDQIDAQEIVLDVFLKLYERKESFESLSSIKAFLYISTKNSCFNAIEKEKVRLKRVEGFTANFEEPDENNILSQIVLSEVYKELYQALELLPEQCKIIMQQLMEGKTPKEVSQELDISVSTINSQKARAISILKKRLSGAGIALLLLYF